jgi:AraC-like DNA-binding protein
VEGKSFSASVRAQRVDKMVIFDRHASGVTHQRPPARVRRDGFDHFMVQLIREGHYVGGPPDHLRTVNAGEIMLFDMTKPQFAFVGDARMVTLSVAREVVEAAFPNINAVHGAVIPREVAGLLGDFMVSLTKRADNLSSPTRSRASWIVGELIGSALGDAGVDPVAIDGARLQRVYSYIDANLHRQDLCVDDILAATEISRSVLYREFEMHGGVARYILDRRLSCLRKALSKDGETRTVAALAFDHGFKSESHCNRAFKQTFGLPPRQYRVEAARQRAANDDVLQARHTLTSMIQTLY